MASLAFWYYQFLPVMKHFLQKYVYMFLKLPANILTYFQQFETLIKWIPCKYIFMQIEMK